MAPVTESQTSRINKQPLKGHPSNKIKVLLDSGSDGDLFFLPKGRDIPFPYLTRQVPSPVICQMGALRQMGGENQNKIL